MNDNRNRFIQVNRELYLMNRGWEFTIKSNDQILPSTTQVLPASGNSSYLIDYLSKSKKLVLVLSGRNCSTCVDQLLFLVKNEIPEILRSHVLVLYSIKGSAKEQWIHRQKILTGTEFLEIGDQSLQLPMDSLDIPYFFMAGPELVTGLAFAPYPSLEIQTKEYLNLIRQRFFN
jgi:hypothetical protein